MSSSFQSNPTADWGVMSRRSITDAELLKLIECGVIVLHCLQSPRPLLYVRGTLVRAHLNEQGGRRRIHGGKRYRWKIRYNGRCRMIMCNRLVWMYVHGYVIPDDYIIHHGAAGSKFDGITNLSLESYANHQQIHYGTNNGGF